MRKLLLSALILGLAAVAVVTPYLFGMEAERIFERQMVLLNASNRISIVDSRFQRGWFSSTAETTVAIRDHGLNVFAEHYIQHGPFPIGDPLKYLLSLRPLQALIDSRLSLPGTGPARPDLSVGTLITTVNIDSTTSTRVEIPSGDTQLQDAATLAWQRIQGNVDFEPIQASWQGALDIGGIDWSQHESSFSLGKSVLTFLTFPGSTGLPMGQSSLATESVSARIPGSDHLFQSTDLTFDSTAVEQGRNVEYGFTGEIAQAVLPTLKLSGATWHVTARDLDLDTLTELNEMGVDTAIPLNKLLTLISRRNASLDSGLTLLTDSGPLDAMARVRMAGGGSSSNPLALIGAVDGEVSLEVPAAVADLAARAAVERELSDLGPGSQGSAQDDSALMDGAVQARIQSWLDANLLIRDGDRYKFHGSISDSSIKVNGKPLDILSMIR